MFHTQAIVLTTRPYREHDELASLFTKDFGKQTLLVKGAKKSLSKLAPFLHAPAPALVACSFVEGRARPILTSADILYRATTRNFSSLRALGAFMELCDALLYDGQKDDDFWHMLVGIVQECERHARSGSAVNEGVYDEWLWRMLVTLGMCPPPFPGHKTRFHLADILSVYSSIHPFPEFI